MKVDFIELFPDGYYLIDDSTIHPDRLCTLDEHNSTKFDKDLCFHVFAEKKFGQMWREINGWQQPIRGVNQFTSAMIMTRDKFHYGTYVLDFTLPNFVGMWPAVWAYDRDKIPPEIDFLEVMYKPSLFNCFRFRHKVQSGLYQGKDYATASHYSGNIRLRKGKRQRLIMRWREEDIEFLDKDSTVYYRVPNSANIGPVNWVLGMGVGNWGRVPDLRNISPLIIHSFVYYKH